MIKYPGHEIAFWSVAFIIVGAPLAFIKFVEGKVLLACIAALLPLACILIWLDVRPARWLAVAYLGIASLGAIWMLFTQGFISEIALCAALGIYTTFQFAVWNGRVGASSRGD